METEEKETEYNAGIGLATILGFLIVVYWIAGRWDSVVEESYVAATKPVVVEQPAMASAFTSMGTCMAAMAKAADGPMKIMTDKPLNVIGTLADGRFFGCYLRETYSSGTYIHGQVN